MAITSPPYDADSDGTFRGQTLARLVEHVRALVPVEGLTFVTVDEMRGTVEQSAGWFADEILRDALGLAASHALDPGRRGLVESALERERPLLLPRIDAWEAAPDLLAATVEALGPERARVVWRSYRGASVIACPLRTEIGRTLGVLLVASLDPGRPLGPADVRSLEVVADLAAMALERARLLEEESRRARDELLLKRAGEAVSASLELEDVYHSVVAHATELTGATKAVLTRLNSRSGELHTAASVDLPDGDELAGGKRSDGREADGGARSSGRESGGRERSGRASGGLDVHGAGQVARTRRPIRRERGVPSAGIGSLMHAPIELGPRLYGVLSVGHDEPDRFSEGDLDLLDRLARSSAAAIANAIDFERERRIARALTLGFVPESLPEVPGYETGLLYAPALGEPTGGDVYGAWRLPNEDVAVLVGDVAGKGVENAALSAMVRFFVEARSWDAACPSLVLEQTNAMLQSRLSGDMFVTAFLGVLSPTGLRYCNAGHLPPLHVSDAGVRNVAGHGLPLGIEPNARYTPTELALAPGDLVFAYTDGLTEARRGGETFGAKRLAELFQGSARKLRPEQLVAHVHEEIAGWADGLADDAVALALRRAAPRSA